LYCFSIFLIKNKAGGCINIPLPEWVSRYKLYEQYQETKYDREEHRTFNKRSSNDHVCSDITS
jgi:hypothetical protein